MSKINYTILGDSMVLNFDGQTIPLNKADHRYQSILDAIKSGVLESIPALLDNSRLFEQFDGIEVIDEELYFEGKKMPLVLSRRIFDFAEEGLPVEPLILFFEKLAANPSYNSRRMLYEFLEHNGHPITQDGNFIAYRGVTSDFKDNYSRKFDNSVGAVCEMNRSDVDENPNNTCSAGLHVACYEYAKGFGEEMIEVEVNPVDVVAVPTDYNGTKMRCCKFKVVNICKVERTENLYEYNNCNFEEREFDFGDFVKIIDGDEVDGCFLGEILEITDIMGYGNLYELTDTDGNIYAVDSVYFELLS